MKATKRGRKASPATLGAPRKAEEEKVRRIVIYLDPVTAGAFEASWKQDGGKGKLPGYIASFLERWARKNT